MSTSCSGVPVARMRATARAPTSGSTSEIAVERPAISAATSAVAVVPRYQTWGRSVTHSRASVVFPVPGMPSIR